MDSVFRRRRSGSGFSLDEAASIRRAVLETGAPPPCPRCDDRLEQTAGTAGADHVWMLHCPRCGAGIVIQEPAVSSHG
ncbi:MAG TPA: hypothetical protein VD707_03275 [Gemmatimonadales bacterium]|nr:hypothetical protein [Gemmatimonadales bacterium]